MSTIYIGYPAYARAHPEIEHQSLGVGPMPHEGVVFFRVEISTLPGNYHWMTPEGDLGLVGFDGDNVYARQYASIHERDLAFMNIIGRRRTILNAYELVSDFGFQIRP